MLCTTRALSISIIHEKFRSGNAIRFGFRGATSTRRATTIKITYISDKSLRHNTHNTHITSTNTTTNQWCDVRFECAVVALRGIRAGRRRTNRHDTNICNWSIASDPRVRSTAQQQQRSPHRRDSRSHFPFGTIKNYNDESVCACCFFLSFSSYFYRFICVLCVSVCLYVCVVRLVRSSNVG